MSIINMKVWVHAARLRTLPLAMSGILTASFIAKSDNTFQWQVTVLALITTLLLQILSNLANDYGDFKHGTDNENRIGPERTLQSGAIKPLQMKKAMYIVGALAFIFGIVLLATTLTKVISLTFLLFILLGILAIGAAIKYTVGKSNFGYKGFGDIIVFIFFGIVAVCGTYFLHTSSFKGLVILPSISNGLLSTGVLHMNNMRDVENDRNSNKITMAVRLGTTKSKIYHTILILGAILTLIAFIALSKKWTALFFILLPSGILLGHLLTVLKNKKPKNLDPELKRLSLTTLLLSILFGIGIIL